MGLTNHSVGINALDSGLTITKRTPDDKVIALAGNPNVGKSSIFNALTGMNQHTGNWPGKTVSNAQGYCLSGRKSYVLVDIPGTYSLMAHSAEEEIARNFICFGKPDAVVVVCDATCLERNLNLVLQTMEISSRVVVCVNLMDEAERKKIHINLPLLSRRLGVPVIGTSARKKSTLEPLLLALDQVTTSSFETSPAKIRYPDCVEHAIRMIEPLVEEKTGGSLNSRWLSLRLLHQDNSLLRELSRHLGEDFLRDPELLRGITLARKQLFRDISSPEQWNDVVAGAIVSTAERLCRDVVSYENAAYRKLDFAIDRLLTSRLTGFPLMLLMLAVIFWITIYGANYPSALLSDGLFFIQDRLTELFRWLHAPAWLHGLLVLGLYRVLAWVVSVMLPPMAIFFPLFTLLEDAGYLPRIAYNLDKPFQCCRACGKQALTMCMGFTSAYLSFIRLFVSLFSFFLCFFPLIKSVRLDEFPLLRQGEKSLSHFLRLTVGRCDFGHIFFTGAKSSVMQKFCDTADGFIFYGAKILHRTLSLLSCIFLIISRAVPRLISFSVPCVVSRTDFFSGCFAFLLRRHKPFLFFTLTGDPVQINLLIKSRAGAI